MRRGTDANQVPHFRHHSPRSPPGISRAIPGPQRVVKVTTTWSRDSAQDRFRRALMSRAGERQCAVHRVSDLVLNAPDQWAADAGRVGESASVSERVVVEVGHVSLMTGCLQVLPIAPCVGQLHEGEPATIFRVVIAPLVI